jgi:putative phosphoribosyl transferase
MYYKNRTDAALALVPYLEKFRETDAVLLAIPRGGVPIACTLAEEFDFPVELLMTKKIGHPDNPEFAIGAVSLTDYIADHELPVSQRYIDNQVIAIRQQLEERRKHLEGERKPAELCGRTLIVIDDGIATGKTVLASVRMLRGQKPAKIVVAVPVSSPRAARMIELYADELICPHQPPEFLGVGEHYEDFSAVSDDEAAEMLTLVRKTGKTRGDEHPD